MFTADEPQRICSYPPTHAVCCSVRSSARTPTLAWRSTCRQCGCEHSGNRQENLRCGLVLGLIYLGGKAGVNILIYFVLSLYFHSRFLTDQFKNLTEKTGI